MWKICLTLLFLIGSTKCLEAWTVSWNQTKYELSMDQTITLRFNLSTIPVTSVYSIKTTNTNPDVVEIKMAEVVHKNETGWIGEVKLNTLFLGSANVTLILEIDGEEKTSDTAMIIVKRPERVIDIIFTASVAIFVSIMYINFGCAMDWSVCHETLKRPVGPAIGLFCQFLFMPLISYFFGYLLFPDYPEMRLGLFFTGISPSGGASNIWTVLLGGNLNLSVTMTTIGTLVAFGMIPVWLFTLGRHILAEANLQIPYSHISMLVVSLIVPLAIGYVIQKKCPNLSKFMVRIMKPFAIILIIFIVTFAIFTNMYLFKLFSWQILVAGMGIPWMGFVSGLLVAWFLKQPKPDICAIAVETGIQNTGISIFLLRFAFGQPQSDLTTVAPVSIAMMTPVPLSIIYIIMLIRRRRGGEKMKTSTEKLNSVEQGITVITNSPSYSTINQVS